MTTASSTQQPLSLQGRDFLTLSDYTQAELLGLLAYARELKEKKRNRIPHRLFEGRSVALYFEKPSNRTRVSFEVGLADLGVHPIMLRKEEINLGVRESIADTARTLSRYVDGIMIRTFAQKDVEELAKWATVPVINGLTDAHHPCQVMADLLTIQEKFGEFKGRQLTFIGDGSSNMAHSLLEGCAMMGMDVIIACPEPYVPQTSVYRKAMELAAQNRSLVEVTTNVKKAAKGASVLYTDVWTSMGQEAESAARKQVFKNYQINEQALGEAQPDAMVLHCLPAHRGEEITDGVLEQHAQHIFDQAENRLHAQKAILASVLS